jgi:hypothetical protein
MKRLAFVAVLVLMPLGSQARADGYGVFCASGKIEIDGRSADQMRSQRGACQFARFPFRMDAESFAKKNFGKVGASCSCR